MKDSARRLFHRGVRLALLLPGGRKAARLARWAAPAVVEWLALRYRAYEQRAGLPSFTLTVEQLTQTLLPEQTAPADMSEDEARLYRQFVTIGIADPAAR